MKRSGTPAFAGVTIGKRTLRMQTMIAIIFEVEPHEGKADAYFGQALNLKPLLETMPGFISVERFESVTQKGKFLSLSFWKDEESVKHWRNMEEHRRVQEMGRKAIFKDYRLRVANVIRDYGMNERAEAPKDSKGRHIPL